MKNSFRFAIFALIGIFLFTGCGKTEKQPSTAPSAGLSDGAFAQLERHYSAKLGVYALDTETNKEVLYRADERFLYCSTSKALLVGIVLQQNSLEQLKQVVKYSQDDILSYAPVTKEHVEQGMTLEEICIAALRFSDNTAANLLFNHIGGPAGFKSHLNKLGDNITEPVRLEPHLNEVIPGDNSDTSTPRQLAIDLQAYTTGNILTEDKRKMLIDWMAGNVTGKQMIRAGAPADWLVADKSGSGSYGTRNDIAIVMPPNRKPIIIAIVSTHAEKEAKYDDQLIAQAAKIVFDSLAVQTVK